MIYFRMTTDFSSSFSETCSDPIYLKVNTVYDWIREQICCMAESPPDKCDPCPTSFSGVGDISLKLTVELDDYPEETAISFQNIDTGDELLFFEHGDLINEKSVSETVRNIGPGKYRLLLNDIYGDGISSGSITLSKANGGELWSHSGRFEDTLEATFTLDPEGSVLAMEVEPPEEDVPNFHGDHSLTIDITFDEKPAETTIQLVHYDSFASVGILHGADYEANARASITYHDLPSGTYTLTVRDDGEDGTGQLEVRDENDEVLYNSDGKFSDYLTVDIKVD